MATAEQHHGKLTLLVMFLALQRERLASGRFRSTRAERWSSTSLGMGAAGLEGEDNTCRGEKSMCMHVEEK